jgi:hypothetical protein
MALLGTHVLLISHGFPPEDDLEFNEWYIREHMPERVALPGFNRGRRYRAIEEGPKYMAFYETTDAGALGSEDYLKLVRNFDPHSRQFVPRFQSPSRTISVVRASVGLGETGMLGLIGFEAKAAEAWRGGAGQRPVMDLVAQHGVAGVHLIESDEEALAHSRKGHLRQGDLVLPWTLLVEAIDEAALDAVWRGPLAPAALAGHGANKTLLRCRYRLLFSVTALQPLKPPN